MTNKFRIYSHEVSNPEAEMVYICSCETRIAAQYVVEALEYRDKGGNTLNTGAYDYYIKEDK